MEDRDREKLPPYNETAWSRDEKSKTRLPKSYIFPEEHIASATLDTEVNSECTWSYNKISQTIDCRLEFQFLASTQFGHKNTTLKVVVEKTQAVFIETVVVRDRLILGLGDSYASGEGNPDKPTLIDSLGTANIAKSKTVKQGSGRWAKSESKWVKENADWLDPQCHRSLFSQHVMAALKLAGKDPHETITILPLACSGAEVVDGLLMPQKHPPGGGKVADSQLNIAVRHLCKDNKLELRQREYLLGKTGSKKRQEVQGNILYCPGEMRVPDAIFLSIGGNDVAFTPAITWATLPARWRNPLGRGSVKLTHLALDPVCPKYTGQKICEKNEPVAKDRISNWLPDHYRWLSEELKSTRLSVDGRNVFLTAYPNPGLIENGTYCGANRSSDALEQARSRLPKVLFPRNWQLQITEGENLDLDRGLLMPLFTAMKEAAATYNWIFVDEHTEKISNHGICSGYIREVKDKPLFPHILNGAWYPQDPSESWAYDVNVPRWFRNTNDSILFQTDSTNSDINGAFHIDFRAHAHIADKLSERTQVLWNKL